MKPIVAYIRVSTESQGRSGLGLEAQRARIGAFAKLEDFEIVAEFTEVETGKGADALDRRPQLKAAMKAAKRLKCECRCGQARSAVARCRVHRRPDGRSGCRSSSPRWAATSIRSRCTSTRRWPSRNARMISQRTTAGLQAAKARGVRLGNQAIADDNRTLRRSVTRR